MTVTVDLRTEAQKLTHTTLIIGTDKFMANVSQSATGASYAAWACTPDKASEVLGLVKEKPEIERVREVQSTIDDPYIPSSRYCTHLYIYVVEL